MLDTWEGGWDSGSSCWTLGRGAHVTMGKIETALDSRLG